MGTAESEHQGVLEGERLRFGGFKPGVWTVWIDLPSEGHAAVAPAVMRDATLGEGRTDLGTLRFESGSRVLLRVRVNEGRPAIPVRATATRLDGPPYDRSNRGSPDAIGGLGPGRFRIRMQADVGSSSPSVEEDREVDGEHDIEVTLDLREPRPTQSHDGGR